MTPSDLKLIEKARMVSCYDFGEIDNLIALAESDEAKEQLRLIRNRKYHMEEMRYDMGR